jgi:single-stranded-DNA-specific exonuclease
MRKASWHIRTQDRPTSAQGVLEVLLKNRGADAAFLNGTLKDLQPHLGMRGMEEGAELLAWHLTKGHKLVLVGDYDCDGITSVAQMALFLRDIDYRNFAVVIPVRAEGYGMPERAVEEHSDARLFVTLDCGTADVHPVSLARSRGADCIVIDHHEVPSAAAGGVAPATVLINPKQPGCPSVFKEFCSSGLTLLFLSQLRQTLRRHFNWKLGPTLGAKYLTLAALATIADVVPLVDGNRIITRTGLAQLNQRPHLPLRRIAEAAGLAGKELTTIHLGFNIAPRINAAGRIGDPLLAYNLLVAEDSETARKLAQELNQLNLARQKQENLILEHVRQRFTSAMARRRTLVMADPRWSGGLVGIVASRIQQEFLFGPVIVLAIDEPAGVARGSARSVAGFDIHAALERCGDLLIRWGGHKMAAGVTVAVEQLDAFAERFEAVAQEYQEEAFIPKGEVDLELELALVTAELSSALKQLEPYGHSNPAPSFAARNVTVAVARTFGRDSSHLRLSLDNTHQGIFWRGAQHRQLSQWQDGDRLDAIFQVEWDPYRQGPILYVKDLGRFFD